MSISILKGMQKKYSQLIEKIARASILGKVVVMPDFCVDRFATLPSLDKVLGDTKRKALKGGGSIHGVKQKELKGGNAVNVAYALGKLGIRTRLISIADRYSLGILQAAFSGLPSVELRILEGRPCYTISLEFSEGRRVVNVMLSDTGSVADFDASKLTEEDWLEISNSKFVAVLNWAANRSGTKLAKKVFSYAKEGGVRTFFDPADLTARLRQFHSFIKGVLKKRLLDVLSLNENEARAIAKLVGLKALPTHYGLEDVKRSARILAEGLETIVDLHTPMGSCSSLGCETYMAPSFRVRQMVSTGAGDVWDAGDLSGYLMGLGPDERLTFANACAAFFVSSEEAEPPSVDQVISFLKTSD